MRILIANTNFYCGGGDSTYTFNLAQLLREHGHEVAFFAMKDNLNMPDCNSDLFVSNIDYRELHRKRNPVSGLKVLMRSIYSVEARKKFGQLLTRFKPDIIHLQNIHHHITTSIIFEANKHNLPIIWTLHDYKLVCPNTHFLIDRTGKICEACYSGKYYQAVLKKCKKNSFFASLMATIGAYAEQIMKIRDRIDIFITPSNFLRNKLLDHNFDPDKVKHIPLFLPEESFDKTDKNNGYFLFLGRLASIKGIYQLLKACRILPDARLIIAGRVDENLASELPQLLPKNANYVGIKHGEELKQLLTNALALVLPSLCYENQPFSILEAFANGKPVIASNIGGMTELVANKKRGLLVSQGDVQALADAMEWMFAHPAEAKQMGANAYEYVRNEHSADIHYQRLTAIYKKVLN